MIGTPLIIILTDTIGLRTSGAGTACTYGAQALIIIIINIAASGDDGPEHLRCRDVPC